MTTQHDYDIANGTGQAVRGDINSVLQAIVSNNSGTSEPATTFKYQWWADETNNVLKIRNSANNAWITLRELDGTLLMEDGSVSAPGLSFASDTNTGFFSGGADKIGFATGGAERLEIGSSEVVFNDPSNDVDFRVESNGNTHMLFVDAGNDVVGIGTSTPNSYSSSAKNLVVKGGSNPGITIAGDSDNTGTIMFADGTTGSEVYRGQIDYQHGSEAMVFFTNGGSAALTIDSSQRLLVGSSSSQGSGRKLQVADTSAEAGIEVFRYVTSATSAPVLNFSKSKSATLNTNTAVVDDDFLGYIQFKGANGSGYNVAAQITSEVDGTPGVDDMPGRLVFSTTADGASTPTERCRIDSNGNMGVGTSSPESNRRLTVDIGTTSANAAVFKSQDTGGGSYIGFMDKDTTNGNRVRVGAINDDMAFITAGDENMRIDSSGNVGIGTSSIASGGANTTNFNVHTPSATSVYLKLSNSSTGNTASDAFDLSADSSGNAYLINRENGYMVFHTNNTERVRIKGDGETFTFSSTNGWNFRTGSAANTSNTILQGAYGATSTLSGTTSIFIYSNGNIKNTNNSYGAISDAKLKENIVDANSQWDDIKGLRVRNYNFIEGQTHTQLGVVAQEVETVSPGLVTESPDRDEDGNDLGTVTKSVNYSVLYMKAVKALQEAMDRIETLETKVAALEAS